MNSLEYVGIESVKEKLTEFGRTYFDEAGCSLYCNWTCSGVEFSFTGSLLTGDFISTHTDRIDRIPLSSPPGRLSEGREEIITPERPVVCVFLDGSDVPYKRFELCSDKEQVILFSSEKPETHTVRIVKLTENFRAALAIRGFLSDGTISAYAHLFDGTIEFIGDSITCGFGNETNDPGRLFHVEEENGWITHGALVSRRLNLKPSFICVSGITVSSYPDGFIPGMEELYAFTDRIQDMRFGKTDGFAEWDFRSAPSDIIVLNLGTNDAVKVFFSEDPDKTEKEFEDRYCAFIKKLRALNGPDAHIVCALGSLDYYLYDSILRAAERVRRETGDKRIYSFKYKKMIVDGRDFGACSHPSRQKHADMADELTAFLKKQNIV